MVTQFNLLLKVVAYTLSLYALVPNSLVAATRMIYEVPRCKPEIFAKFCRDFNFTVRNPSLELDGLYCIKYCSMLGLKSTPGEVQVTFSCPG